MGHNAIITFPEEEDKKKVLVESHYYGGHAPMSQQLLPFGSFDHSIPQNIFCKVYPHATFDLSLVENISYEATEEDIWNMGIEGLTEVRLFDIAEKCDGKSSEAQRKYRFENEKLKFGYFYFDKFDSRKKFDNSCRERQYIFQSWCSIYGKPVTDPYSVYGR